MDFFEVVRARYCYRDAFTDNAVPRADLEKIVQAGLDAPSGRNAQTTRFILIDDAHLTRRIGGMHAMPAMQTARAIIACVIEAQAPAVYQGHAFSIEDCAAAVENMLLAITALGYASVWIDGWLRLNNRAQDIGRLLGVPEHSIVRVLLPIGVPVCPGPRQQKKAFAVRVGINTYQEC